MTIEAASADQLAAERRASRLQAQEGEAGSDDALTDDLLDDDLDSDLGDDEELPEGDQPEGDDGEPDEDAESEEANAAGEEEGEADADPPIDPPQFWSEDAKKHWPDLPRQTQEFLSEQDQRTTAAVNQKMMAIADEVKKRTADRTQQLDDLVSAAVVQFQNEYANITDERLAQLVSTKEITSETAFQIMAERNQREASLKELLGQVQRQRDEETQKYVAAEADRLRTLMPEFFDEKKGPEIKKDIMQYAAQNGVSKEDLEGISARDLVILRKAMMYDRNQAKLRTKPAPKPAPKKVAKPTGGERSVPQNARIAKLEKIANANPTPGNLAALRKARRDAQPASSA